MKRRSFNSAGHAHFLTFSCFHGRQFLADDFARRCLGDSIGFARDRHDFAVWAYVFMPDHVHLLIHPRREQYSIGTILRDIKEHPSRRVIRHVRENTPWKLEAMKAHRGKRIVHRLWQAGGGYDRNLFTGETIRKAIEYIERNPVRRGLVANPSEWEWSSARARSGMDDVRLTADRIDIILPSAST